MSAVAAIVRPQGTVLFSDGITFKHPNGVTSKRSECEIVHTDFPKVFKVNDSVGVTWVGNALPEIQEHFKEGCRSKNLIDPHEIAEYLSGILRDVYKGKDLSTIPGTPENVNISITGYDSQGRAWGCCITCKNNFEHQAYQLATNGYDTMCAIPFKEGNDNRFDELLEKYNQETTNPKELGLKAFTEMIRDYEAQDMIVGGEIFSITLRP